MKQEHEASPVAMTPTARRENGTESITGLVHDLAADVSTLFSKEIELAKSEIGTSVAEARMAVGSIATGGAIAMAGLVVMLMSAVYGLSNLVAPWLAALVVGGAAILVGYLMVRSAKGKMSASSIVPERTVASTKKDKDTVKRASR